jgi:iron complex transport system substrate-binding protein
LVDSRLGSDEIDAQVKERLRAGLPLYGLNEDLLRELAPDLIITQSQCDVCAIQYDDVLKLVASAPEFASTKVLALSPSSLDDILADVLRVANSAGQPAAGESLFRSLQQRRDYVANVTASLDPATRPRVVCIEWVSPVMMAGNWTPELLELAGGRNGLAQPREHSRYISWPDIVQFDPQVVLVAPCGFALQRSLHEARQLIACPEWLELSAVKSGQAFVLDGNALLNRSGPRIVDSLELIAYLLHPAHHPPPAPELAEGIAWRRLPSR